jgi:hypothetical protein
VPAATSPEVAAVLSRLSRSSFRRRQRLSEADTIYLRERGLETVLVHAERFLRERLAPADPVNEGKQTPMRGHPAFVAQHATATCCRSCLAKWHGIQRGRFLTEREIDYAIRVMRGWLEARR